jgi:hypothetical protein
MITELKNDQAIKLVKSGSAVKWISADARVCYTTDILVLIRRINHGFGNFYIDS